MDPSQCSSPKALSILTKNPSESTSATDDPNTLRLPAISPERDLSEKTPVHYQEDEKGRSWDPIQTYLRQACGHKVLTSAEEAELFSKVRDGDQAAREKLITSNLRLVVKIAREYEGLGLPLLDLVSQGNIGLMRAIDRFDPTKGARLGTYAPFWVRQLIRVGLAHHGRTIRLPVTLVDKICSIRKTERGLQERLRRPPTERELASECKMTPERVRYLLGVLRDTVRLNTPLPGSESDDLASIIPDERTIDPGSQLLQGELCKRALHFLDELPPREKIVINRRMGLDGDEPETLREIGERLNLTRERVRQIESQALKKLRLLIDPDNIPQEETSQDSEL